jgi:hypothetical protein
MGILRAKALGVCTYYAATICTVLRNVSKRPQNRGIYRHYWPAYFSKKATVVELVRSRPCSDGHAAEAFFVLPFGVRFGGALGPP